MGLAVFILSLLVILIMSGKSFRLIYSGPNKLFFSLFILYSLIVSIVHRNTLGFLISICFFFFFLFFNYYQEKVCPDYLEVVLKITLYASFILFIYAFLEYFNVIGEWDYAFISPLFGGDHPERVQTTFYNPNYYALMLEFFILIGLYKINETDKSPKKTLYGAITLCNILAVYFTGNRSTPVVFVSSIVIFYFLLGKIKVALTVLFTLGPLFILLILTGNYPRVENLSWAFQDRFNIWETALQGIRDNLFFGQGPLTYRNIYMLYDGQQTYHAHNIILDTLLSHGIVGTSLLIYPFSWFFRLWWKMKKDEKLRGQFALHGSLITAVLIHGIVDLGILWFQTGFLFLLILLTVPNFMREQSSLS